MSLLAEHVGVRMDDRSLLRGVDVEVEAGELLVILGPNGAGKSTLLGLLAGDRPADAGRVTLQGLPLDAYDLDALAGLRAVIGTPAALAFDYTVADVVAMGWRGPGPVESARARTAIDDVLRRCALGPLADRIYMTLSSGERQRVQCARGLLQVHRSPGDARPRWLLLDEPTSNLDVAHAIELMEILRSEADAGAGVCAIVHDLDLGARFADRVLLLDGGRAVACGTPGDVLESERLSTVYGTPVFVGYHRALDRRVVLT